LKQSLHGGGGASIKYSDVGGDSVILKSYQMNRVEKEKRQFLQNASLDELTALIRDKTVHAKSLRRDGVS